MAVRQRQRIFPFLLSTRRELSACLALMLCPMIVSLNAGTRDPFPLGYSMGNNGTIIQANGPSCRQPWIPACFSSDSFQFGVSVCGIDYYDAMDNLESSHIAQVAAGAWYSRHRFFVKASYAYFNAMGLYNEQQGFFSLGCRAFKAFSASIEMTANRTGFPERRDENEKFVNAGASLLVSGTIAALSISCSHLPVKTVSSEGFEPPIHIDIGLHTTVHPFGAQGVLCEITKESDYNFRFSIGESYCMSDHFALTGALSTTPFMMHVGLLFSGASRSIALSFVNHPVLGWSKGLSLDYARR